MAEKVKAPAIRFKGFTDDWEQRGFSELFTTLQNNALSRADLNSEQGVAMNVHYGDVLIKFGELLDVSKERVPFITDDTIVSKYNYSLLNNGDVIIADAAEDETVGKCSEIVGLTTQIIISGLHTIPCRPIQVFASGYLGYYMNSSAYHDQLLPLIQGTKVSSISKSALSNTVLIYPESNEEQLLIAKYFTNLDNLITLHQHKFEKLQNVKKAMLEKMFPKNGSNVPEIRFAGFTDAWEQRELGSISDIRTGPFGSTLHAGDYVDDGTPIITTEHFKNGELPEQKFGIPQVSEEDFRRLLKYVLRCDDIVFSRVGSVDINALITPFQSGWLFSGRVLRVRTNDTIESRYLHYELSTARVRNDVVNRAVGQTMPSINTEILKKTKVYLPIEIEEQREIGQLFSSIDNLITLHQRKLEKLRNVKKAFLEKMFV
jgi:type I restriction enzyme S subunit